MIKTSLVLILFTYLLSLTSSLKTNNLTSNDNQLKVPPNPFKCLKSLDYKIQVSVTFVNNNKKRSIYIYWVDYGGNLVLYNILAPGKSYVQITFVTHPWVFITDKGKVLGYYLPSKKPVQIFYIKSIRRRCSCLRN